MTEQAETLIKTFEGLRLNAYRDSVGVLSIGYGHTGVDVVPGMKITVDQAEAMLNEDIANAVALITQYITVSLNQNQLDSLTSLVFNLGVAPLKGTLGSLLNKGFFEAAALQFPRWCHAGGQVLQGLVTRRAAEQKLFQTPVEDDATG